MIEINIEVDSDELTIICSDGGVACIRVAEPLDDDTPRIATTDYYQSRLTDINPDCFKEDVDVWNCLAEGHMYYNDWEDKPFNSLALINDALSWLGHSPEECLVVSKKLFPEHFK